MPSVWLKAGKIATAWFDAKLKAVGEEMQDLFSKYRISEALMAVYKLFWDEFSSWYLEMVKPAYINGEAQPIDRTTYEATLRFFDILLKMLHPFMPFITEELWQALYERNAGESIMRESLKLNKITAEDEKLLADIEQVKQIVSGIRMVRNQKNIAPKEALELQAVGQNHYETYNAVITKMANVSAINVVTEKDATASAFMIGTDEFAVPLGNMIDVDAEIEKMEAQLKHLEGFLQGVMKKLSNERFVANAPEAVVAMERKKQSDSEEKSSSLLLAFINNVYSYRCQPCRPDILGVEGLMQTDARGEGTDHGNKRIPDGHLANRIAGEQFVVERKTDGRDAH